MKSILFGIALIASIHSASALDCYWGCAVDHCSKSNDSTACTACHVGYYLDNGSCIMYPCGSPEHDSFDSTICFASSYFSTTTPDANTSLVEDETSNATSLYVTFGPLNITNEFADGLSFECQGAGSRHTYAVEGENPATTISFDKDVSLLMQDSSVSWEAKTIYSGVVVLKAFSHDIIVARWRHFVTGTASNGPDLDDVQIRRHTAETDEKKIILTRKDDLVANLNGDHRGPGPVREGQYAYVALPALTDGSSPSLSYVIFSTEKQDGKREEYDVSSLGGQSVALPDGRLVIEVPLLRSSPKTRLHFYTEEGKNYALKLDVKPPQPQLRLLAFTQRSQLRRNSPN